MRSSDWRSDVCSSDLVGDRGWGSPGPFGEACAPWEAPVGNRPCEARGTSRLTGCASSMSGAVGGEDCLSYQRRRGAASGWRESSLSFFCPGLCDGSGAGKQFPPARTSIMAAERTSGEEYLEI